ncbi:MAG: hypothetical protein AAGI49_07930 [Bacteroidota bacterium]
MVSFCLFLAVKATQEFVEKVHPIKIYEKANCRCVEKIAYPSDSKLRLGMYQPTFYEPMIALDRTNNELEFVFPKIEARIYRYDLEQRQTKASVSLDLGKIDFPEPVDWEGKSLLKSRFQSDHSKAWFSNIFNYEGNTLVSFKKSKQSSDDRLHHKVFDNNGLEVGVFSISESSEIDYLLAHRSANTFFALPDMDRFAAEPKGFPISVV